jgi:hypothetical protein
VKIFPKFAWDGQYDMAVLYCGKNSLFHFSCPVIYIGFGTPGAKAGLTAKGNLFDMAAATAVFGIAIGEHAASHHLLDIILNVFIHKVWIKTLELFPVVSKYLDKPVFVINWKVIYHGTTCNYSII